MQSLSPSEDSRLPNVPNPEENVMNAHFKSKTWKSKTCKSKTAALAIGMIGGVMMWLASASAETTVRDHRDKPVVNEHRAGQPQVNDHRGDGAVTVRESTSKRKSVDCLGNFCNKKVCVGPACF
jgi:hypothetical protein